MKLNSYLKEKKEVGQKYPELDKIADDMVDGILKEINKRAKGVKSEMPYKSQYILEELIKYLENNV